MSESGSGSKVGAVVGCVMLLLGLSVFAIRLQHAGPYALPRGGNGLAGVLALLLGAGILWTRLDLRPPMRWLRRAALLASGVVGFFALYATFSELEEVVVLKATNADGQPVDLRLWVVDREDGTWVTMSRGKADAHSLADARVDLLRRGELACVTAKRHEDRATVNQIHALRQQKYALQRLATAVGIFGHEAGENTIALRLDPGCG